MEKISVFCDGGARGNPGPAGVGCVIKINQGNVYELAKYIGKATNNQAEYQAVIVALNWFKSNASKLANNWQAEFFLDSKLVVEQLNQRYKIKNEGLKPLFWQVREQILSLGKKVTFKHIPREKNKEADRLVNKAIDDKEN